MARIAVLGGNGFVGQRVLEQLVDREHQVRCFSRSGHKPVHMQGDAFAWTDQVEWIKADGTELLPAHLANCDGLICVVGAPPIPRVGAKAIKRQQALNGDANVHAIGLARQLGIKHMALLGAQIPYCLRNRYFGYFLGKRDSLRAAREFASSPSYHASVVQPFFIVGRRYLKNGKAIPLDTLSKPFKPLSFGLLQDVEEIAQALVDAVFDIESNDLAKRIVAL